MREFRKGKMNNKSTEQLIESGGSIEELFVPSLDLEQKKSSTTTEKADSESARANDNRRRAQKNFLVEKSSLEDTESKAQRAPVAAVRKYSLPPVASKRNGKELKENSNQQTRKRSVQSDTVQIISKKPIEVKSENDDSGSGSDSDTNQAESVHHKERKKIELSTFNRGRKKLTRKPLASAEVNEESTSFISYEEKHEKEDNSEHLTSNHSSENNQSLHDNNDDANSDCGDGIINNAFVHDPDDDDVRDKNHAKIESPNDSNEKHVKPRSKRGKKQKSGKTSKEKRKKRPSHTTEHTEKAHDSDEHGEIQEAYDFKKVIGKKKMQLYLVKTPYNDGNVGHFRCMAA